MCLCVLNRRTLRQSGTVWGTRASVWGIRTGSVLWGHSRLCAAPGSSYSINQPLKQWKGGTEHVFENRNLLWDPKNQGLLLIMDLASTHTFFPHALESAGKFSHLWLPFSHCAKGWAFLLGAEGELHLSLLLWLLSSWAVPVLGARAPFVILINLICNTTEKDLTDWLRDRSGDIG